MADPPFALIRIGFHRFGSVFSLIKSGTRKLFPDVVRQDCFVQQHPFSCYTIEE